MNVEEMEDVEIIEIDKDTNIDNAFLHLQRIPNKFVLMSLSPYGDRKAIALTSKLCDYFENKHKTATYDYKQKMFFRPIIRTHNPADLDDARTCIEFRPFIISQELITKEIEVLYEIEVDDDY